MKPIRHFVFLPLLMLLVALGLSLVFWQARKVEATAHRLPVGKAAPFVISVENANDSGSGSLRQAIADASAGEHINFDSAFFTVPRTITLTSGELAINKNLTIQGPGANLLTISGNQASRIFNIAGGGLSVAISGLTISNGVTGQFDGGGGILSRSNLTLTECDIVNNLSVGSGSPGGGVAMRGSVGTFTGCTFSGNTGNGFSGGGAVFFLDASGTFTNCTISGNSGYSGGGIKFSDTLSHQTLAVTNCTVANNNAEVGGTGGILIDAFFDLTTTVTLRNTIIANNTNGNLTGLVRGSVNANAIKSLGYNLTNDNSSLFLNQTTDQLNKDPLLGPLQNNGGPTPTRALLGGSPALNAGSNPNSLTTDQRGVPRVSGTSADIGAVEMQALIVTNTTDSLGAGTLRQAITDANANGPGLDDIIFGIPPFNTTQTINLLTALPDITSSVTINGPGANLLTVRRAANAATNFRIFNIPQGITGGVTISGLTITGGNAGSGGVGGGISCPSSLTLTGVHVTGNTAGLGGGVGVGLTDSSFTNCTFSNNSATGAGGGGGGILYQGDGNHTLRVVNSTVSGNSSAIRGGGIYNLAGNGTNSRLEVVNSTIANNTAPNGGGIHTFTLNAGSTATTTLRNTIIANNTPNNLGIEALSGGVAPTIISQGFNLTSENSLQILQFLNQPTDFVNTDPLLGPLQDNGGPTPTRALLFGSRALDAGHSSGATTDQRGLPRRVDLTLDNQAGGDGADIGAYELQATPVQLGISDVSKNEGNSGQTAFDFTVSLLAASTQTVTVIYNTQNGTAQSGVDYGPTEGQLTFTPGQTSKTITIQVNGDTTVEPNETFLVNLRNATNATLADAQGLGTILNDDQPPPPTLAINDVSKNEGNSGTTAFDFTVTLSAASTQIVTVDYISGGGTAQAGSDYTPVEGRLTFAPGQTSRTITVLVNGDTTVEPNETFLVDLRSPTNATLADGQGQGTIVNDDVPAAQIVQNTNDSGAGSLRQVIADAPAGSTVTFVQTVFNVARTITLASEIQLTKSLTINGPGAHLLTISGNNNNRVLRVQGGDLNVTLNDLTISNGNVNGSIGGGILSNGALTMNRCVIANNKATTSGGGIHLQAGATGVFTACTFSGNTSASGGALYLEGTGNNLILTLTNCTISGNTGTATGGALFYTAASGNNMAAITNCTIANNESADGGGIFIRASANGATPRVATRNSIFANNTNTNLRVLSENGGMATISSLGYNLTTGSGSGLLTGIGDQINTDPLLGPLQINGGTTPTHALLVGSPAIDKGHSSNVTTDQRAVTRPTDDPLLLNATGGDGADIGAFERSAPAVVSAASFKLSPLAQESIVALFGENLTTGIAVANSLPLPTTLDSTSVQVRDSGNTGRNASLFFVSPGQLNFQLPPGTATGAATVSVLRNGTVVASTNVTIAAVEPALFTANASGTGIPAALLYRVHNALLTIESVNAPIDMGPAGDVVVLVLYGGGLRNRTSLTNVAIKIGGVNVAADYAGPAPDFIGLDQVNTAALPRSLAGRGLVNLELTVDGKLANVVTLNFR